MKFQEHAHSALNNKPLSSFKSGRVYKELKDAQRIQALCGRYPANMIDGLVGPKITSAFDINIPGESRNNKKNKPAQNNSYPPQKGHLSSSFSQTAQPQTPCRDKDRQLALLPPSTYEKNYGSFRYRKHPKLYEWRRHFGKDIGKNSQQDRNIQGKPILSPDDGEVIYSRKSYEGETGRYFIYRTIKPSASLNVKGQDKYSNFYFRFLHVGRDVPSVGQTFEQGEAMASVAKHHEAGTTSTGAHIHAEMVLTCPHPKTQIITAFYVDPERAWEMGTDVYTPEGQYDLLKYSAWKMEWKNRGKNYDDFEKVNPEDDAIRYDHVECRWFDKRVNNDHKPAYYGRTMPANSQYKSPSELSSAPVSIQAPSTQGTSMSGF